ncbi:FKBP-type peptidyl-prolyl cis-trans isomerase family protein [Klebsormidium nitens]|uniref:peptidylprolyl isomerase n=1 Tax=Klebsormidium nitens TaxID=105231 RepID=A0A1Y1IBS2_KLENI|nr:FKBP-type peptidyl-prolyl cis-trans isomerase family protein [Klebsormidium nitens]|eukprot:GAQ88414.1 FKBP-type peptidyl-prolyl cis-trans isomerase family protein [Klebsormidium nitens]
MAAARQLLGCHQCSVPQFGPGSSSAHSKSWAGAAPSLTGFPSNNAKGNVKNAGSSLRSRADQHRVACADHCCERYRGQQGLVPARSRRICCGASVNEAQSHSNADVEGPLGAVCSRRQTVGLLGASLAALSWSGATQEALAFPGPDDRREAEPQVFFKTPSGTKVQELLEGTGPAAQAGNTVTFHYVCRRSNGYYVYSTVDGDNTPASLPLGQGRVIQGLEEVLSGMRAGGKRRALIPPSAGYVDQILEPIPPGFGPQRSLYSHAKEPLVFEVLLLKVK